MSFSDLPWEILLEIAYQLDDAGMNALCRTNRQIYNVLNGDLYRRDLTRWSSEPSCICSLTHSAHNRVWGCRSLHWALCKGVEGQATVQQAIAAGQHLDPIPKRMNEIYKHTLVGAAAGGHTRLVELLLEVKGIDPNDFSCWKSPLALAATSGHVATTKFLLATSGVDPNIVLRYKRMLRYLVSCQSNLHTIINLFLDYPGIGPNCDFEEGESLLILAITKLDVLKLLLDREDIDINKQDDRGYTALFYAFQCFTPTGTEPAKLLLDRDDIDVNLPNRYGETPLYFACRYPMVSLIDLIDLIDLLLKKEGVDVNARDIHGCTPLGTLCYLYLTHTIPHIQVLYSTDMHLENVAKARLLLSHPDTDPNPVDNNGVSLLSHVILNVTPVYGWQMELLLSAAGATQRCIQYCQTLSD
ncbi:Ankyrin repeat-containing domain protein [Elaphomyces granulatus]